MLASRCALQGEAQEKREGPGYRRSDEEGVPTWSGVVWGVNFYAGNDFDSTAFNNPLDQVGRTLCDPRGCVFIIGALKKTLAL